MPRYSGRQKFYSPLPPDGTFAKGKLDVSSYSAASLSRRLQHLSEAEQRLAPARTQSVYGRRAGPLGRASRAGLSDLCVGLATVAGGRRARFVLSVAGQFRGAALRLCARDADWYLHATGSFHRYLT